MPELYKDKHERYFRRCINILPTRMEAQDSNKMAIAYFSLAGLDTLNALHTDSVKWDKERTEMIEWVYSHLVPSGTGFRGSYTYNLGVESGYDSPNLAATGFALQILITLKDPLERLDKGKIMGFVKSCQLPDGQFCPIVGPQGPFGDTDLRYCMIAATIRKILNYSGENDIDLDSMERYVLSTLCLEGGMASGPCGEPHAGLTFCGIDSLALTGKLDLKSDMWDSTIDWLVHRQISYPFPEEDHSLYDIHDHGGFNGRANKPADTCYVFWVLGSLKLLGKHQLVDLELLRNFLLNETQNGLMGGFAKTADDDEPDPYHSFLGLAALAMLQEPGLAAFDAELVITV